MFKSGGMSSVRRVHVQRYGANMYDLHCHLLPSIDDGAPSLDVALEMSRIQVDQGVETVACTPHILPGLYHNTGQDIVERVEKLRMELAAAQIPLTLVAGADNHVTANFVGQLDDGHLLSIGQSRYVLVEPPHHVAPVRLEDVFFDLLLADYTPVLTHPERLTWIETKYDLVTELADKGVWMQITSGSLLGRFGKRAKYWAERMICEGRAHILASDAHNCKRRPPDLGRGARAAEALIGADEAHLLVVTRPAAVLNNLHPTNVVLPTGRQVNCIASEGMDSDGGASRSFSDRSFTGRMRRFFS